MSTDWWAKKLGTTQQPRGIVVPPQAPQYGQQQPVQQFVPQPQPQYLTPQQQAIQQAMQQQHASTDDPNRQLSLREAVSRWQGGEAWQKEGGLSCPGCGSLTQYTQFSGGAGRANGVNGSSARGHCFACGYNGSFEQGLASSWAK